MGEEKSLICLIISGYLAIPSEINQFIHTGFNIVNVLILVYLAVVGKGFKKKLSPILKFLFFSIITAFIISGLFSAAPATSAFTILRQATFFVIVYLIFAVVNSDELAQTFFKAVIFAGVLASLPIVYGFISSPNLYSMLLEKYFVKEGGVFSNVASVGGTYVFSIPLNYILWEQEKNQKSLMAKLLMVVFMIQILGLLLTSSRGALLGISMAFVIYLFITKIELLIKILTTIGLLIISLILTIPSTLDIINNFFRLDRVFENTRYIMWDMSFSIIGSFPFFGTGPGLFKYYIYKYLPVMLGSWDEQQIRWLYDKAGLGYQHNFYLFLWSEVGIPGLIIAIMLPVVFFLLARKVLYFAKEHQLPEYKILLIASCSMAGIFFRAFFETTGILSYGWVSRDIVFWIVFVIFIYFYHKYFPLSESLFSRKTK